MGAVRPLSVALLVDGMLDEGGAQGQCLAIALELVARGHRVALASRWPLDARTERVRRLRAGGVALLTPKWQSRPLDRAWPGEYNVVRAAAAVRVAWQARAFPSADLLARHPSSLGARERAVNAIVVRRLAGWLRQAAPATAVLHVVARHSGAIVRDLRRLERPIVFTELGQVEHYESGPPTRFGADAYTADSLLGCEVLARLERRRVEHIPGTGGFPEPTTPAPERATRIASVSRLSPEKRIDLAVRAVAIVDGVTFDVYGSGPEEDGLRSLVAQLGLEREVRLHGPANRDGVRRALDATHAFVLTSRTEGTPTAIVEAMSRGRAVVATGVGGVTDVVRHEGEGLLVGDSPAEVAHALVRLRDEPGLAARLGAAARRRWERELAPAVVVDRYEDVYRATLENSASGGRSRPAA